jgi:hypothetical protein
MKLSDYIAAVDGSEAAFAERCGLQQRTVNRIASGEVRCRIDIADVIVKASRAQPAPSGETVRFEDLVPEVVAA